MRPDHGAEIGDLASLPVSDFVQGLPHLPFRPHRCAAAAHYANNQPLAAII